MNDLIEMIQDLRELQHLYATNDLCYLDFQEKIEKYSLVIDEFEAQMENQYGVEYENG